MWSCVDQQDQQIHKECKTKPHSNRNHIVVIKLTVPTLDKDYLNKQSFAQILGHLPSYLAVDNVIVVYVVTHYSGYIDME